MDSTKRFKHNIPRLSPVCRKRLHTQGYREFSDQQLFDFRFGIRFAYGGCIALVGLGLYFQSIPILAVTALVAVVAASSTYHPLDYVYNYGVRYLMKKPKLPPRTRQGRFACGIAFTWLVVTIYFFYNGYHAVGNILLVALFAVGALVTFTDICIPSMIYNTIFGRKMTVSEEK